jgi:hypothetical protein
VYHVKLHLALVRQGAAEPGWWWRPTSYHDRLAVEERRTIMLWFRSGAAGFLMVIVGCVLVLAAVLTQ